MDEEIKMMRMELISEGVTDVRVMSRYGDFMGEMRQGDVLELPVSIGTPMVSANPLRWKKTN